MAGSTPVSVLYDYVPTEPDELELRAGDTLQVLAYLDDGWCQGYVDGAPDDVGLFPSNYVRKIEHKVEHAKLNSHLPPFRSNQTDVLDRVRALHDYTPQEADELELHAGDIVVVTKEQDDGWCLGYLAASPSVEGLFPANYVAPLQTGNSSKSNNNSSDARRDETSPPATEHEVDEDPYYMRNRRPKEVAKPMDEPALDEPPPVASEASASDGYYDARGFYITAAGYYDTQGTFFPASTPAATTAMTTTNDNAAVSDAAAGYYDEYGNYIVDGGYYDTEGLFHATAIAVDGAIEGDRTALPPAETSAFDVALASEADESAAMPDASSLIAVEPSAEYDNPVCDGTISILDGNAEVPSWPPRSMDLPSGVEKSGDTDNDENEDDESGIGAKRQSVQQLKRALEKAKRASERAEQARLQAERDMELELETRRKALQRQLDEEQAAKAVEASLHAQMHAELQSTQEAHAASTILRSLRHHTFRQRHAAHVRDKAHKRAELQRQQQASINDQKRQREAQRQAAAHVLQRSLRHRVFKRRAQQSHAKWQEAKAKKLNPKPRRYHSKVHVTAANRIQRATRDYLACKEAKATANDLRSRRKAKAPAKARVIRPQKESLVSSASTHSLLYASRNPSSSELPVLVPLYATDVAQISQLATLIANSVNLELGRRLAEHDAHLSDLTASMHTLQHVIEKHNAALHKVYDQNERLQYTLDASPLRKRQVIDTKVSPMPLSAGPPAALKPLPPSPKHIATKQHRHPSPLKPELPSPPKSFLPSPPKPRALSPPRARGPSPTKSMVKPPLRSPQHHTRTAVVKPSPPSPRQVHKPVAPSPTQRVAMAPSPKLVQPSPTKTRLPQLRGVKPVQGLYYKKAKATSNSGKSPPRLRPPQGFSSKLKEPPR
ncbi:hypothetical protein SDRG_16142 [Saprolegnia diclina VS20]|uniref:SH3 domain-containing protein n=1 Tax=Saprolegnia diclina (strain VS20) TaxID=1156394 RepID=T0PKX7_SAPDV|nr:hypothetical protein SDRG_16142 [Saprolegnia diclina VS20]EQC25994.1 hypothetical protein SDRG_16142 [Saprolegnia diclina VS20]|eukprot:XP_008620562.1 hypothetical protein SDRG_16142 [Saprolegnia diclina VS20]